MDTLCLLLSKVSIYMAMNGKREIKSERVEIEKGRGSKHSLHRQITRGCRERETVNDNEDGWSGAAGCSSRC